MQIAASLHNVSLKNLSALDNNFKRLRSAKVLNNEVQLCKSVSSQDKMKVLPEQILAWLKSTFGKDEANQVFIATIH